MDKKETNTEFWCGIKVMACYLMLAAYLLTVIFIIVSTQELANKL